MKKTKRILCALLAVIMIVPMMLMSVSAAPATPMKAYESIEDLGWTNNTTNGLFGAPGAVLSEIVTDFGTTGNKAIHFVGSSNVWNGFNVVSAEKMAGVTKFTAQMTVKYTSAAKIGFHLNASQANSSLGDWAGIDWTTTLENRYHTGSAWNPTANVGGIVAGEIATITAVVDLEAKTVTVTYSDGVHEDVTSTRETPTAEASAIVLATRQLDAYVDDIIITNNATNAVIYSEDFEGFLTSAEANNIAGRVLYENDFGDVAPTIAKLGWADSVGSYGPSFKNGKPLYELTAAAGLVDGSKASLKIEARTGISMLQMVSAETMKAAISAGDTYSVSAVMDVKQVYDWFGFSLGNQATNFSTANGEWVISRGNKLRAQTYSNGGAANTVDASKDGAVYDVAGKGIVTLKIVTNTATAKQTVYVNDVAVITDKACTFNQIGAIHWILCGQNSNTTNALVAYVDNIVVKNETTNSVVYSEDFEAYAAAGESMLANLQGSGYKTSGAWAGVADVNGKTMLKFQQHFGGGSGWYSHRVVPASALIGVEKYTIRYTLNSNWSPAEGTNSWGANSAIRFAGETDTGNSMWLWSLGGNHTCPRTNNTQIHQETVRLDKFGSSMAEVGCKGYTLGTFVGTTHDYAIEVDHTTGIVNVYIDGVKEITYNDCYDVSNTGVDFMIRGTTVALLDNVLVTAGGYDADPAVTYGVQETAVADGKYNVRFIGLLGDKYTYDQYTKVGLTITCGDKVWDTPCTTVYDSIVAGENVGASGSMGTLVATEEGGKYFMAYTIKDIPASAGEITFTVTSYFETADGKAEGTTWNIVYNAGEFVSMTIAH